MPAAVEFIDAAGVRLAYRRSWHVRGEAASGIPVVLLHALAEDSATWDALDADLARAGRASIAIDLRGHGQSDWPGDYSFEVMVNDVIGVLDVLGVQNFDIVGHSLGGHLALYLAGRCTDRVRRLVAEDPPPPPETYVADVGAPARPAEPTPFDWEVVQLRQLIRTPDPGWWARLGGIRGRTLIIGGGSSSHVDQDRLRAVVDCVAKASFVTVDVGHSIHRADPERFAQLVLHALA